MTAPSNSNQECVYTKQSFVNGSKRAGWHAAASRAQAPEVISRPYMDVSFVAWGQSAESLGGEVDAPADSS